MRKIVYFVFVLLVFLSNRAFPILGGPSSIAMDKEKNVYALSRLSIYKYNQKGEFIKIINDKMNDIYGEKHTERDIYVGVISYAKGKRTSIGGRITKKGIEEFSRYLKTGPSLEQVVQKVIYPTHITVGPQGKIYVVGEDIFRKSYKIGILCPHDGHPIEVFDVDVGEYWANGLWGVGGLVVDSEGKFYITDSKHNTVKVYSKEGKFLRSFGERGEGDGKFRFITAIAIDDKNGYVYVTDSWNPGEGERPQVNVQKFTKDGKFILKWGGNKYNGWAIIPYGRFFVIDWRPELGEANGLSVDSKGDVYVLCCSLAEVKKFTPEGRLIMKWGKAGKGHGEFRWPEAIAIDKDDNVYVADTDNNRIQKFDSNGKYLMEIK